MATNVDSSPDLSEAAKDANELIPKGLAEGLMGGVDEQRKEVERAKDEARAAQTRVELCEAKLATTLAYIARVLEGVPMAKLKEADRAKADGQ